MKAVIIAHGEKNDGHTLTNECKDADIILCADGGADYAFLNKVVPDFLIGDFDSINKDILDYFINKGSLILKFPTEKDFTDTELCVEKAINLGCDKICILYGVGKRIDHSLGNIGLLHKINQSNCLGYIAGDDSYIYICSNTLTIWGNKGDTVSIIPLYGDAIGLVTDGLKYALNNTDIAFGKPIGISNIMTDEKCTITINSGEVLVVKQKNI